MDSPLLPAETLLSLSLQQVKEHAIVLMDAQGNIVAWLAGAEALFGYNSGEMTGQPLDRLFTPEDRAMGTASHELAIARATGIGENDRWLMRKDGSRIWVGGATSALRDEDGAIQGFCKIMRDRTDLKVHIDSLEHRAHACADALERTKVFIATLAHELRNPLGALSNGLEVLRLTAGGSEQVRRALDIYGRQLGAMKRLLDDVMDTARAEKGKLELKMETADVNDLMNAAAGVCRLEALNKQQHLEILAFPTPLLVRADPDRMQQVLVNLLHNAVKYTFQGGRIWIKATTEGDEAVVRVLDTGIGMSEEALPRVFEVFTQEGPQGQSPGLGLGLALVRQLVELHGGSVQARSGGRNKGSEFTVRLPLSKEMPPAQ
jgi:PAS domain S-box-containing protein